MIQAIHFVMGRPQAMRASVEGCWTPGATIRRAATCWAAMPSRWRKPANTPGRTHRARGRGACPRRCLGPACRGACLRHDGPGARGLDWLTGREASWAHCNNFRFHVWWHRALMHLDLGEHDAALALYDADIRAEKTDDYRDISNAASLLARLELEGVDVGRPLGGTGRPVRTPCDRWLPGLCRPALHAGAVRRANGTARRRP
jgi:hypothetical protein